MSRSEFWSSLSPHSSSSVSRRNASWKPTKQNWISWNRIPKSFTAHQKKTMESREHTPPSRRERWMRARGCAVRGWRASIYLVRWVRIPGRGRDWFRGIGMRCWPCEPILQEALRLEQISQMGIFVSGKMINDFVVKSRTRTLLSEPWCPSAMPIAFVLRHGPLDPVFFPYPIFRASLFPRPS